MNSHLRSISRWLSPWVAFQLVAPIAAQSSVASERLQHVGPANEPEPASFFWGDYDGDGFDDAFVIVPSRGATLLRNLADGTLEETTTTAGLTGIVEPTLAGWADMDQDGDLDLFVGTKSGPSALFHNEGSGTFVEVATLAGLNHTGEDVHGGWIDYDKDGLPDLHVRTRLESILYRNLGRASFQRVDLGLERGVGSRSEGFVATGSTPGEVRATGGIEAPIDSDEATAAGDEALSTRSTGLQPAGAPVRPNVREAVLTERGTAVPAPSPIAPANGVVATASLALACAHGIKDQATAGCLQASSVPQLGKLYPISSKLFVDPTGRVGLGTTAPTARLDVNGDMDLAGTLSKDGVLFMHDGGDFWSVALGAHTLKNVTAGVNNTAVGACALVSNTTGSDNVALGYTALYSNTAGSHNVAVGGLAMALTLDGERNTAVGSRAMYDNRFGARNTAVGAEALAGNLNGTDNVAIGDRALALSTMGSNSIAIGSGALSSSNDYYGMNVAIGTDALASSTYQNYNVAIGFEAMEGAHGSSNIGIGWRSLNNASNNQNIAIGSYAGYNIGGGIFNIDIGNQGVSGDTLTTRIGWNQLRTFIAGIRGATTGVADAIPVLIDSAGQLGTLSSSRRFKEEVEDMDDVTDKLLDLRPVTFRFKSEVQAGARPIEYGLIAEEVAEVFPDLVVYGDDGEPFTVKYHILSSMLLNELQKLSEKNDAHERDLADLRERLRLIEAAIND